MEWKSALPSFIGCIVAALTLQLFSSHSGALRPQNPAGQNSILHLVKFAKAKNQDILRLQAPMTLPLLVPTLADVFKNYTFVRALVIASMPAIVDDHNIITFYKLYGLEVLHRQAIVDKEPRLSAVPPGLLPLVDSEFLMRVNGGSLTIDGMPVFQACGDEKYSLEVGKEYLMALLLEAGGDFAISAGGSSTILRIEGQKLIPLKPQENPFWIDIQKQHLGELDALVLQAYRLSKII